jgi:HEAT repeat protein
MRPGGFSSLTSYGDPSSKMLALRQLRDGPESLAELLAAAEDPSPEIVREALRRLARSGDPDVAARLRALLLEADPGLTGDFAAALAVLGDDEAAALAARALVEGRPHRRIAAATALEVLAASREIPALLSALRDPLAAVRSRCLQTLVRIGADIDAPACAQLLADTDASVRTAAVEAVAALAPEAAANLEKLVDDNSPAVRRALARRLSLLSETTGERLLRDHHRLVREAAIGAAGREHAAILIDHLHRDAVAEVRMAAARRLAEMRVEAGCAALIVSLADRSPIVRVAALGALRQAVGREATVDRLLDALEDGAPELRRAIVYSLARLEATEAEWAFSALTRDPDRDVRIAVAHCGARLFGPDWGALDALLADPDPAVANAATVALGELVERG